MCWRPEFRILSPVVRDEKGGIPPPRRVVISGRMFSFALTDVGASEVSKREAVLRPKGRPGIYYTAQSLLHSEARWRSGV